MTKDALIDLLIALDYAGAIGDVLARLPDEALETFHALIDKDPTPDALLYFGMRRSAYEHGDPDALYVTFEQVASGEARPIGDLVQITLRLVMIEWMRRKGFLKVEYPRDAFTDDARREPFSAEITPAGRARQKRLATMLGKENGK